MGKLYWHEVKRKDQLAVGDIVSFRNVGQWQDKGTVKTVNSGRLVSVQFPGNNFDTMCDYLTLYKWDEDNYITREYADYWLDLMDRCEKNNPELDWSGNAEKRAGLEARVR